MPPDPRRAPLRPCAALPTQIKPEHVLVSPDRGAVTLLDFTEAVNKRQRCLNNRAGALEYMVGSD